MASRSGVRLSSLGYRDNYATGIGYREKKEKANSGVDSSQKEVERRAKEAEENGERKGNSSELTRRLGKAGRQDRTDFSEMARKKAKSLKGIYLGTVPRANLEQGRRKNQYGPGRKSGASLPILPRKVRVLIGWAGG